MYSVVDYGLMAACSVRMDAYGRALARAVKPGHVVVDIGAGTGIFSLLAARAGARRVHAIDPNPAIWLLRDLAVENRLADRIVIHATSSFDVELEERADVVVSDVRGSFPLADEHLAILRDARQRLLRPDGILLPTRDRLMVAAVEAQQLTTSFGRAVEAFTGRGLTAASAWSSILNTFWSDRGELRANERLTTAEAWATVEYGVTSGTLEGEVSLAPLRGGRARGLALWFEATIADGIGFDNAPGTALVYARYFLPLLEPVDLAPDDRVRVVVRADERGNRFAWDTTVTTAAGAVKARFRQSSFLGVTTSPEGLLRSASTHAPTASTKGRRVQRILELMDGARTVDEIVEALQRELPSPAPRSAVLEEVQKAVERYAR